MSMLIIGLSAVGNGILAARKEVRAFAAVYFAISIFCWLLILGNTSGEFWYSLCVLGLMQLAANGIVGTLAINGRIPTVFTQKQMVVVFASVWVAMVVVVRAYQALA